MSKFFKRSFVIGSVILLSACQPSPTFINSAASIASNETELYWEVLIEAGFIFVLVAGVMIWSLIRDRRKKGDTSLAAQIYGKAAWAAVPIVLVLAFDGLDFVLMLRTMNQVAIPAHQSSDLNLRIVCHRWWWEFDYTDENVATANELHIPVGATVQITLESVDVIHSFWIPQLSGKTDVVPGQHNTMWLKADKVGEYLGQCAEFCGTEHALMRFKVFVDSKDDYDAWLANQKKPAYQPQTSDEQAGYSEVTGACAACHSIDPSATETTGPNLAHLQTRTTFAGGTFDLNEQNLRSWLKDTQAMKPGNDMQVNVSSQKIDQIISYLMKLK